MKPINVKKYDDICNLKRDNWSYGDFTIGFNSHRELYIHEQKIGEYSRQRFLIPFHVLKHFIKKLNEDSK